MHYEGRFRTRRLSNLSFEVGQCAVWYQRRIGFPTGSEQKDNTQIRSEGLSSQLWRYRCAWRANLRFSSNQSVHPFASS